MVPSVPVPLLRRQCAAVTTASVSCSAMSPVTKRRVVRPIRVSVSMGWKAWPAAGSPDHVPMPQTSTPEYPFRCLGARLEAAPLREAGASTPQPCFARRVRRHPAHPARPAPATIAHVEGSGTAAPWKRASLKNCQEDFVREAHPDEPTHSLHRNVQKARSCPHAGRADVMQSNGNDQRVPSGLKLTDAEPKSPTPPS